MTQQSAFLITTLEKIGAPLAAAVEEVSQRVNGSMDSAAREVEDAKVMAQLLGQTIQVGLSLGGALIQASDEAEADALRLAVAAMVAPVIAHYYRHNGAVPDDAALGRMTKSLEATIAFAENFNPASEHASRLSVLGVDTLVFDEAQVDITALDALVPVLNAIGVFSFGLSETKLLQDVSEKLKGKAASLVKDGDKLSELTTLKALAKIYAQCHLAEVNKLSGSDNEERGELSIDPVWAAFDTRLAMVNMVLGLEPMEETVTNAPVSTSPQVSAPVDAAPATAPVQTAAPAAASAAPSGGGPMSFFTGGGNKEAATIPAGQPTEQAQAAPVTPQTPPVSTPAPAQEAKPAVPTAPATDQSQAPPESSASPMSFFKPGAKPVDEETGQQG